MTGKEKVMGTGCLFRVPARAEHGEMLLETADFSITDSGISEKIESSGKL